VSDSTKCGTSLNAPPTPTIVAIRKMVPHITLGVEMTANSDGHSTQQPYSRRIGLLRSVCVLEEWLEENEGKIADEVRIRRIKRWRAEALQQLRLNP
jgi:hypothetical protein